MGTGAAHEEGFGRILPHSGLQDDGEAKAEKTGKRVSLPPTGE